MTPGWRRALQALGVAGAGGPAPLQPLLRIQPQGWQVPLSAGRTLLQAALAAGVRLPSSCRNGSCRACRCRLLAGRVRYTVEWPGLLAEEKAEGWVLPCVAVPELGPAPSPATLPSARPPTDTVSTAAPFHTSHPSPPSPSPPGDSALEWVLLQPMAVRDEPSR